MPGPVSEPISTQTASARLKVELPKAVQKRLRNEKITYIAVSILTLGLYAFAVFIMDKIQAKWINQAFMPSVYNKPLYDPQIQIPTYDKVNLDATEYLCEKPTNKWVIYFCGNGDLYEKVVGNLDPEELGANILYFNYRGCGHSEGTIKGETELLLDGCAAVEHLKRKGIENKDIEIFGVSIGGAVGAITGEHYPGIKYMGDRTLKSISAVVSAFTIPLLGAFIKPTRFEINAFKAWKNIPDENKALIYHHKDGIVRYPASMYYADKQERKKKHPEWRVEKTTKAGKKAFGLDSAHKPTHVKLADFYDINKFYAHNRPYRDKEYKEIMGIARQLLHS